MPWPPSAIKRSTIDSSSYFVRRSLLRMLSTIVTDCGPSGSETVLNALDHVKASCIMRVCVVYLIGLVCCFVLIHLFMSHLGDRM